MRLNPLLSEISRGLWCMHIPSLEIYGVLAHKLITGEKIEMPTANQEPKALVNYFTESGSQIKMTSEGQYNLPQNSIAVVDMIGAIIKYGDWCTYGADEIVAALFEADRNPNVAAIILNVDGPGGSVSAIAPFKDFGMRKTKPVVGLYDQCCSAHLYSMLVCADYVMASNDISAQIGSVGVVLSWRENKAYLESLGYKFHEVYPDESENKNEAFRLAMDGKYDMIKQEMLSPMAVNFQNAVKAARPKLDLREPGLLTGKTFFTDKAIGVNLVDGMGNLKDAMNMALMLSEMNHYKNV
ncbi:MAG TPA: S49 family peptidase [Flavobacterium sp.]|nr:S49 family peptidase [Flavobacterium sp.]